MAVYTIFSDRSADEASGNYGFVNEAIEGDILAVFPIGDFEFHPVTKAARLEDGTRLKKHGGYQGVPVHMEGMPKKVRLGGKRDLGDFQKTIGHFLVSRKMRDVIEQLESGVHQFQPVELIWTDDSHAADFFWFNPCNRVNGMDRDHTTHDFDEKIGKWKYVEGKKYVVSLAQTTGKHAWVDSRLLSDLIWVSEDFKQAVEAAGISGVDFNTFEAIE